MIDMLLGPLGAVLAGILAVLAAWAKGKRDGRQRANRKALEDYQDTRRRVDDAANDISDDDGVLRGWLRDRGQR